MIALLLLLSLGHLVEKGLLGVNILGACIADLENVIRGVIALLTPSVWQCFWSKVV